LPARIIGVADCFDALTSRRPYRPPLNREAALEHLRHRAGTDFDPVVLAAFLGLLEPLRAGSAVRVTTCPAVPLRSRPFIPDPEGPLPRDLP
jgi:putative two-component system response regulator